jgi:HAD superfamily hydrolase (TIGR01509 family)
MNVKALLFDFDGLLIDTEGPSYRSWAELYEQHGHELTLDAWSAAVGTIGGFDPEADLGERGVALEEHHLEGRRRRDLELCDLEEMRPGVVELLDAAERRGLHVAIVSSASTWWIEHHLGSRELLDRFELLVCANGDAERAKPRPTLYLEALQLLGVTAGEAIAFEDSTNGVAAATAAGIYTVAVPNEVTSVLDFSAADRVVGSLHEIDLDDF